MCIPNYAYARAHAYGYQIELRVLLQRIPKSYEEKILIEVKSSLIDMFFLFIRLNLSWFDIKDLASFKA